MMCFEDKLTDTVTQRTAGEHVGKIVLVSSKSRHAHCARDSVRSDLHRGTMFVFIRDNCRDGPCLRAVTGRERAATVEELAALHTVHWSRALRDAFKCRLRDHTVYQCFSTQQPGLSRSVVVILPANQVEGRRNCAEAVKRAGITDRATSFYLAVGSEDLVARDSIGGNQRHQPDA